MLNILMRFVQMITGLSVFWRRLFPAIAHASMNAHTGFNGHAAS